MLFCTAKPSATLATSPSSTGTPFDIRSGIRLNWSTVGGLEFISTLYSVEPMRAVPAGTRMFELCKALTTSFGETPLAVINCGFRSTMIWRSRPPNGAGTVSPGMVNSFTRTKLKAWSKMRPSGTVLLDNTICTIGTVAGSYWMISGGVMPGGKIRRMVPLTAFICAIEAPRSVP